MKANQLATLVLRLIGIYFLAEVIADLPISVGVIIEGMKGPEATIVVATFISLIAKSVIGILLIVFSGSSGEKLSPQNNDTNVSPITFRQAQTLAFAVAGVLIFAGALPQLVISIFGLFHSMSFGDSLNYLNRVSNSRVFPESVIGPLLKAALGIWLFFGADGFANFFSSMRNFGTPKPPQI